MTDMSRILLDWLKKPANILTFDFCFRMAYTIVYLHIYWIVAKAVIFASEMALSIDWTFLFIMTFNI